MKFHLPSFVVGCGVGFAARSVSAHFRPVLMEIATAGYRLADSMSVRAARAREDLEDLFAEARARATSHRAVAGPPPSTEGSRLS